MVENDQNSGDWDQLLIKYVYVWLWSILLGVTTTIGFSFVSYRSDRWGILGLGLIVLVIIGGVCVLASLLMLSRFLAGYLLPVFFGEFPADSSEKQRAGRLLGRSFRYLLIAVAFRFLMTSLELLLAVSNHKVF